MTVELSDQNVVVIDTEGCGSKEVETEQADLVRILYSVRCINAHLLSSYSLQTESTSQNLKNQ